LRRVIELKLEFALDSADWMLALFGLDTFKIALAKHSSA